MLALFACAIFYILYDLSQEKHLSLCMLHGSSVPPCDPLEFCELRTLKLLSGMCNKLFDV